MFDSAGIQAICHTTVESCVIVRSSVSQDNQALLWKNFEILNIFSSQFI